jgi:hypothetical protein
MFQSVLADSESPTRLPFVEGGDGVDIQIHAKAVSELIGGQLRIDTGLSRKAGMRASHDPKRRPFEMDGFQPRLNNLFPRIYIRMRAGRISEALSWLVPCELPESRDLHWRAESPGEVIEPTLAMTSEVTSLRPMRPPNCDFKFTITLMRAVADSSGTVFIRKR